MFAAVVQLHPRTVKEYVSEVVKEAAFKGHCTKTCNRRKGKLSVQSVIAFLFLERYGELHAMACPSGRGSAEDRPVLLLPSSTTRTTVYGSYKQCLSDLLHSAMERAVTDVIRPFNPLTTRALYKVWNQYAPTLRIMKTGRDFCDTCTSLGNFIPTARDSTTQHCLRDVRLKQREEAFTEFKNYCALPCEAKDNPSGAIHLVFDFAGKVLLFHLLRQPGQLHFITGLKFDFFGVHSSNLGTTHIFGLPEGHWRGSKTANEVPSMLHYSMMAHRGSGSPTAQSRVPNLNADNCSGQNKNKYILWYFAWRALLNFEDCITLYSLVAGHTKNTCDGSFGLNKRNIKQRNVFCPRRY